MSTMRLSVKTCTPTGSTYSTPSITTKFLPIEAKILQIKAAKTTSSDIKCSTHKNNTISQSLQENEKSTLLRRREAVGLGFCFTIIDQLLLQQESTAEAAETEFTSTPSGLAYFDKLVGSGSQAVKGLLIKAHYTGKLENGKVFDSSYNRGKPLTFRVGVGEVIKGWDQGILGGDGVPPMQAGGKRSLKIPPQLAYGARGAGCKGGTCVIPPDSVLFFDVEFIGKA